jgi:hypothetical protein
MKVHAKVLLVLLTIGFYNCSDPYVDTAIKVVNESSYDLNITFDPIFPNEVFYKSIDINQGESVSFITYPIRGGKKSDHYNPNEGMINIIISNIDTGKIIKEMNNMNKNITYFEFIGFEIDSAVYQFKITDDLLLP